MKILYGGVGQEIVAVKNEYAKFIECYEITSTSDILVERDFGTTIIKPLESGGKITIKQKPNIDEIIKNLEKKYENECPTCSSDFYENIQETYCEMLILGKPYNVKLRGY